ncbi:SDR family NAD(P)-dependent oxidoreductase, partial [Staphylococcus epidermidis]|uniref:SDR family NAD(P)-dependent oxidoreductase n=1 Tax=Staphylococcus epidermidis TaxID=1282 RepID=UPI0037DA5BE5
MTRPHSPIPPPIPILYPKQAPNLPIGYYDQHQHPQHTLNPLQQIPLKPKPYPHHLKHQNQSQNLIKHLINHFPTLNILLNNPALQFPPDHFQHITPQQLKQTFITNIFPIIFLSHPPLPYLSQPHTIINTTTLTPYRPSPHLIHYSPT